MSISRIRTKIRSYSTRSFSYLPRLEAEVKGLNAFPEDLGRRTLPLLYFSYQSWGMGKIVRLSVVDGPVVARV